ncbi:hypothetical protein DSL92_01325 [Billgrantia gudaonensis]|uniref:Uncharacterized protein n=1 Tax=Billgrantia gudaonensis TaxID=376427 RepID=A0A3S0QGE1_9GAMM|nr:hypothetical protein DSL92_01325 [Halomonas gudaonensis]
MLQTGYRANTQGHRLKTRCPAQGPTGASKPAVAPTSSTSEAPANWVAEAGERLRHRLRFDTRCPTLAPRRPGRDRRARPRTVLPRLIESTSRPASFAPSWPANWG